MFEVRNLTIAQGERPLWQGLSLTVKAGGAARYLRPERPW